MYEHDPVKVEIYLDDSPKPISVHRPPATFELDTTKLPDGPHRLFIRAFDRAGVTGVREVNFIVRNGPGIAVMGLNQGDIVEGKIPVLINAYSGTHDASWEPTRAETPAPVPTWAWVLFLFFVVWAGYYWVDTGVPSAPYANTPTYSSPSAILAASVEPGAGQALVTGGGEFNWAELGAKVYAERCVVCHTATGEGVPRFVASLRGSRTVSAADPKETLRKILYGSPGAPPPKEKWRAWMPPFGGMLSDEEVAAVANQVRTSWGNSAPLALPEQVKALRGQAGQPAGGARR